MRVVPAPIVLLLALCLASACGSARQDRTRPLLAYSNGLDLVLYEPATASRRIVVAGDPGSFDSIGFSLDEPAWSPDGKRLAAVRWGKSVRIEVVDAATGRTRSVTHALGDWGDGYEPRWSPDGRWIAYRDLGRGELWVARSDGSGERLVLRNRKDGIGVLGWTRDGRLVVGVGRLIRLLREGPIVRRWQRLAVRPERGFLRPYAGPRSSPTELPDGRRLAVEPDASGNDQVVVVASGARSPLTADRPLPGRLPVRSSSPRWSPDGRWVAFRRHNAVVVVGADGSRERRVLEDGEIAGWSPDGRYLRVAGSLAARSLWLFEPQTGRRRLVTRAFGRGGVWFEPTGAAWRPQDHPRVASMEPGKLVQRTVETPLPRSRFATGHVRIGDVRRLSLPGRFSMLALSSDGRFGIVGERAGRHSLRLAALDLTSGSLRRLGTSASPGWESPRLGQGGRQLLYRRWHELWSVAVLSGRGRLVARDAGAGLYRWLRDGGMAYVDRNGRVVLVSATGRVRRVHVGSPGHVPEAIAIAPDGDRVIYAWGCDVWLENLRTQRIRRFAHGHFAPTADSWSPTGDRVALAAGWYSQGCTVDDFDWYHAGTALFDLRGAELDSLPGDVVSWSAGGRFVVTSGGVTGSAVVASQPLTLDDLRALRQSTLLPAASTGQAWVLRGGGILFGRYDNPEAAGSKDGDLEPRLYLGRLLRLPPS